MTSTSPTQIQCPTCDNLNAADSRFCRHCGAALDGKKSENGTGEIKAAATEPAPEAKAESKIEAHAPLISPLPVAPAPQANAVYNAENEERSSPSEIDARRARQLLDRSLYLSERGDAAAAILACRQSIALAPTAPGGYSMLGLLLERTGDLPRAITAYEKAVQLAPNSTLERESLDRLREKVQNQKGTALFHFDDTELFGDGSEKPQENKPPEKVVPAAATAAVSAAAATDTDEAPLPNIGASAPGLPSAINAVSTPEAKAKPNVVKDGASFDVAPGLAQSLTAQLSAISPAEIAAPVVPERRAADRRRNAVPVVQERRVSSERRTVAVPKPVLASTTPAPIYIAGMNNGSNKPASTWDAMWKRPSYYGRALPLAGATVLCLGFLLWARGWAVARATTQVAAVPTIVEPGPSNPPPPQGQVGNTDQGQLGAPPPLAPVGSNAAPNGGFPISNGTNRVQPAAIAGGNVARPLVPGSSGTTNNSGGTPRLSPPPRTSPSFPRIIPPAPIPANSGSGSNRGSSNGGSLVLPSPEIQSPGRQEAPISVLPPSGAPPLNPAGASGRGFVRITQGRIGTSALPQRPASQANDSERDAANASRAGQSDRAIQSLSSAIDSDASDAGFRFQQRATLFLERGDYSRAAEDFQSAISAYNAQILRDEQVAAARAGLRAARSGLNLALAGRR